MKSHEGKPWNSFLSGATLIRILGRTCVEVLNNSFRDSGLRGIPFKTLGFPTGFPQSRERSFNSTLSVLKFSPGDIPKQNTGKMCRKLRKRSREHFQNVLGDESRKEFRAKSHNKLLEKSWKERLQLQDLRKTSYRSIGRNSCRYTVRNS